MKNVNQKLKELRNNPKDIKFSELCRICEFYLGKSLQTGTSHRIYKTPWQDDPRVNIQNQKGRATAYQVTQVLKAIERLEVEHGAYE